jgi:hypothetical protein
MWKFLEMPCDLFLLLTFFLLWFQKWNTFFSNQNHSDDPDCNALIRAKEMLSKLDKQGLDSAKPLLKDAVFGFP